MLLAFSRQDPDVLKSPSNFMMVYDRELFHFRCHQCSHCNKLEYIFLEKITFQERM